MRAPTIYFINVGVKIELARVLGFEPRITVLETVVMPFHYTRFVVNITKLCYIISIAT